MPRPSALPVPAQPPARVDVTLHLNVLGDEAFTSADVFLKIERKFSVLPEPLGPKNSTLQLISLVSKLVKAITGL